jgi:hypothetical protein
VVRPFAAALLARGSPVEHVRLDRFAYVGSGSSQRTPLKRAKSRSKE